MWKVRLQGGVRRFNTHPIRVLWGKEKLYLKRDYSTDSRSPVRKSIPWQMKAKLKRERKETNYLQRSNIPAADFSEELKPKDSRTLS